MAVTTYLELQAFVTDHLELSAATEAKLPTLIQMAESELRRLLVTSDTEFSAYASTTADVRTLALPTDFARLVSALVNEEIYLKPRPLDELRAHYETATGKPTEYAIADGAFYFYPMPDAAYTVTIIYNADLAALSDTNASNWLLDAHPDAYVFATIKQVEAYLSNDKRLPLIQAQLMEIIDQIKEHGLQLKRPQPGMLRNRDFAALSGRSGFSITNG